MGRIPYKWYNFMRLKCVEPIKRKHGKSYPEWQFHRFEIKNGISWRDAMIYDMMHQRNPFIEMLENAQPRP
jgi:endonuclease I